MKDKKKRLTRGKKRKNFWQRNGLSIVVFTLFFLSLVGLSVAGLNNYNEERQANGQPAVGYLEYIRTGDFIEAVMENWESEFLQMWAFIMLTIFLVQEGAAESKKPAGENPEDEADRKGKHKRGEPAPEKKPGIVRFLYENSLGLTFGFLFIVFMLLHLFAGHAAYNEEQLNQGLRTVSLLDFWGSPRFWYQSFQNWQSEFFAVGVLLVLSIFLRQKGSAQSKPVIMPDRHTGKE